VTDLEPDLYDFVITNEGFEITAGGQLPALRMLVHGTNSEFIVEQLHVLSQEYALERARGYPSVGALWSPGYISLMLDQHSEVGFVASTEPWETIRALTPQQALAAEVLRRTELHGRVSSAARGTVAGEMVLAADQFIIAPAGRVEEAARARAPSSRAITGSPTGAVTR
jgi:hypothetical protein